MMKVDDEIRMVPPLAYCASEGSYPIIKMKKSEWFPLLPNLPVEETVQ